MGFSTPSSHSGANGDDDLQLQHPVIGRVEDFDHQSGSLLERLVFNNRPVVLALCVLLTLFLGWEAAQGLRLNASFQKMVPTEHTYIANYLSHQEELRALGNSVRIAVAVEEGSIFDAAYLETLRDLNDAVFLLPGVERGYMRSLWTPATRWVAVTEEGLDGGPVIPGNYDGSADSLAQVRLNVERSGEVGHLVAGDFKSSVILVPLLETDPATGAPMDYQAFSDRLEALRTEYASRGVTLHIIGFAKVVGDLIDGMEAVLVFFAVACAIATALVFWYTRCVRSTLLVVSCSLIAVVWQMGFLPLLGYDLDPFSVLVPFLVFAIGMSHGAQKMNGVMQDIGRGTHRLVAARYTFRRLFLAGFTALICDAVGFAVLLIIAIQAIRDLALISSLGVAILVFTNLILLPVLLSHTGVSRSAAARGLKEEVTDAEGGGRHPVWRFLDLFTRRNWAIGALVVAALLGTGGMVLRQDLKVGDLDPGAPELRPDSRYNRDNAFIVSHYATSSDVLVVMASTPGNACGMVDTLERVDALEWRLRQLPGVETTNSLAALVRQSMVGMNEGNLKWFDILPNQAMANAVVTRAPRQFFNQACDLLSVYIYLKDHKADTLTAVVTSVEDVIAHGSAGEARFMLAAGNAGIEAATNIVVEEASREMLFWVYGAVMVMCLITFRSWRAVIVAVLPLVLTSILAEALMAVLGIGVKVATLPIIALGVGIGVDYALYILSVTLTHLKQGETLSEAYYQALRFTGKVVMLTGFTLSIGVATWAFSPIKFQADMGILLAAMFLWNMLGAMVLIPALARFLLGNLGQDKKQNQRKV